MSKKSWFEKIVKYSILSLMLVFSFMIINEQVTKADGYCSVGTRLAVEIQTQSDCVIEEGIWTDTGRVKQDYTKRVLFFPYSNIEKMDVKSTTIYFDETRFTVVENKIGFEYLWLPYNTPVNLEEWYYQRLVGSAVKTDGHYTFELPLDDQPQGDYYLHVTAINSPDFTISGKFTSYDPLISGALVKSDYAAQVRYTNDYDADEWVSERNKKNVHIHMPSETKTLPKRSTFRYFWASPTYPGIPLYQTQEQEPTDYKLFPIKKILYTESNSPLEYFSFLATPSLPDGYPSGEYKLWIFQSSTPFSVNYEDYTDLGNCFFDLDAPVLSEDDLILKTDIISTSEDYDGGWSVDPVYISFNNATDALSGHKSTSYNIFKDGVLILINSSDNNHALEDDGIYTIVLNSIDNAGNVTSITKVVKIGDGIVEVEEEEEEVKDGFFANLDMKEVTKWTIVGVVSFVFLLMIIKILVSFRKRRI